MCFFPFMYLGKLVVCVLSSKVCTWTHTRTRKHLYNYIIMYFIVVPHPTTRSGQPAAVRLAADSLSLAGPRRAANGSGRGTGSSPAHGHYCRRRTSFSRPGSFNGFLRDAFKTPLTRLTPEPEPKSPPTPPNAPLCIIMCVSYT